jgi:hypothetical protein
VVLLVSAGSYDAQLASIRDSRVIAMDETPIKAGRSGHGKMKTGYFWPVYGERDEVCFPFFPSDGHEPSGTSAACYSDGTQTGSSPLPESLRRIYGPTHRLLRWQCHSIAR